VPVGADENLSVGDRWRGQAALAERILGHDSKRAARFENDGLTTFLEEVDPSVGGDG
jgi:hypothetical protein